MDLLFITDQWPQLAKYVPESAAPLRLENVLDGIRIDGYCNNAAIPPDRWMGGRLIVTDKFTPFATDPHVPPGYFAFGVHLRRNLSEYLFAMWERDGRRFWFYSRFSSTGNPEGHSASGAGEALDAALQQWEGGAISVMYDGEWGWFNPATNKWQWVCEDFRAPQVDLEEQVLQVICTTLKVDRRQVDLRARLIIDLGADDLDVAGLVVEVEKQLSVSIPDDEVNSIRTVGDVVAAVRRQRGDSPQGVQQGPPGQPEAPATFTRSALVLRCVRCEQPQEFPEETRGLVRCAQCGAEFICLGKLPPVNWNIELVSAVSDPRIISPQPMTVADLPRWVCPWCGRNLGLRRSSEGARPCCDRCQCNLSRYAALSLVDQCRSLDPLAIGAYYEQAVGVINGAAALYKLGRISLEEARWPDSVRRIFPPPFAEDTASEPTPRKKPWWKFW